MTPTQAQIEAAAKAVEEAYKCYGTEFTTIAICALTAAAEVGGQQTAGKDATVRRLMDEIERLKVQVIERDSAIAGWIKRATAAAADVPEQEHIAGQKPDLLPSGNTAVMKLNNLIDDPNSASGKRIDPDAAAGVGEQTRREKRMALNAVLEQIEAATIERCARVADKYIGTYGGAIEIAAGIRALKHG